MSFTHLHVHTEYSLLDGSAKIRNLVGRAKELGFRNLAITDHGNMYGVIEFYRACKAAGINPVIGCEVYVAPDSRFDRELSENDDRYHHLVLLCENDQGYKNLVKIVSRAFMDGYYYKPRVDKELLREYHGGLIASSACLAGEIQRDLVKSDYASAKEAALEYREIFGDGNFFLELQDHGYPEQRTANQGLLRLHDETGIPLIATNDVHYIHAEDAEAHDVLLCIQTQKKVSDEDRMRYTGGQFYLKSEEEMKTLFPYALEALANTEKIAERCHVEIVFGERKLPKFQVPDGMDAETYLRKLCEEGFRKRYPDQPEKYHERLLYEISVIAKMGFVDYFLIVCDFVNYAKSIGIPVGPGRGSAAGSVVSYTLGITDIDPMQYGLLFERFLNPDRVTMPDIDMDFCYQRRQEVIDYVTEKYGAEAVTQIVTFGTLRAKGVLKDVARVMDFPYAFGDRLSKMISRDIMMKTPKDKTTLQFALEISPEMKEAYESEADVRRVIDIALQLEGLPRQTSMHAAGVVIADRPMDEYVPLSRSAADSPLTTEYTMTVIEELGLLKMDFLGLRTLTVIKDTIDNIRDSYQIEIDLKKIPMDDREVYQYIGTGDCDGIFQLESQGMRSFMKKLQPESLGDIIAGIALYRPGPMDFIPQYLEGKEDRENVSYLVPELEPILKETYGCIVYQEQVMQIVQKLAGYSLGQADTVRKLMSKKKMEQLLAEKDSFIHGSGERNIRGCISAGVPEDVAAKLFEQMEAFGSYAFNKSHAAAYGVVAYQTAYLKYHYPAEFMAALMTSFIEKDSDKCVEYIQSCRAMGIEVLPPDINVGRETFSVKDGKILFALNAIKGIGSGVVSTIVREREANGEYVSAYDFMCRLSGKEVNKKTVENFIKAGAFDCFQKTRREQMAAYPLLISAADRTWSDSMSGQFSLFQLSGDNGTLSNEMENVYTPLGEYGKPELLEFEKEALGIYISGHPLEEYQEIIQARVTAKSVDFYVSEDGEDDAFRETGALSDKQQACIGGILREKTVKTTKKNELMAFLTMEDQYGSVEVLVFPKNYEKYRSILSEDEKLLISGRVSIGEGENGKLILESVQRFSDIPKTVWVQFQNRQDYETKWEKFTEMIFPYDGNDEIVVCLKEEKQYKTLGTKYRIDAQTEVLRDLETFLGEGRVKTTYRK